MAMDGGRGSLTPPFLGLLELQRQQKHSREAKSVVALITCRRCRSPEMNEEGRVVVQLQ